MRAPRTTQYVRTRYEYYNSRLTIFLKIQPVFLQWQWMLIQFLYNFDLSGLPTESDFSPVLMLIPPFCEGLSFVKVLVRWAKGKRLTNRVVPNLSLITLSPPETDRIYGSTRDTNTRFQFLRIQKHFSEY